MLWHRSGKHATSRFQHRNTWGRVSAQLGPRIGKWKSKGRINETFCPTLLDNSSARVRELCDKTLLTNTNNRQDYETQRLYIYYWFHHVQCTVSNFVDDLVRVQLFCTIILGYGLLALGSTYGHRTPSATIRRGKYQVFSKQLFRQAWPVCPVCKCVALTSYFWKINTWYLTSGRITR